MDALEIDRWQEADRGAWRERWGVPELRLFARVGSTNDVAREMAEDGAPQGTLVLADEQVRGRGRRGRDWSAPAGASLSMSMVLRPPTQASSRILTLRLGLAAAGAIEAVLDPHGSGSLRLELKWPNDLGVAGKKVGGILCEGVSVDDQVPYVVAGIGLNLRRPHDGWPADIAHRAASLEEAASVPAHAPALVGALVVRWLDVAGSPAPALSPDERAAFDQRDALRGRRISVDGRAVGVADGVTPTGALRVRQDGAAAEVLAGTVRTLEPLTRGEPA